jgi:ribonuclease P protein component
MKNKRIIKPNHIFQKIIESKQILSNGSFVIYYQKNPEPQFLRYGISVGKKMGNAVIRNRVKRQVRVMVQQNLPEFGDLDYQIIIVVKKGYFNNDFQKNAMQLRALLLKLTKMN